MAKRTDLKRLGDLRKALRKIASYPTAQESRRTKDGYPTEFAYDEFAYKRMVDSYRDAISRAVADSLK
jgi:hypothetical protein